jgi:hypothetical protein
MISVCNKIKNITSFIQIYDRLKFLLNLISLNKLEFITIFQLHSFLLGL